MKKIISAFLLASLVLFSACSAETSILDPYETNESVGKVSDSKLEDMTYIIKVDDLGVSKVRFTDAMMANIFQVTGGDFSLFMDGSDDSKELYNFVKEYVADTIVREMAMIGMLADVGITLSEEDEATLQASLDSFVTQNGGLDTVESMLEQSFTTLHYYENQFLLQLVTEYIYEYYFGEAGVQKATEDDLRAIAEESYVQVKHILVDETSLENATDEEGEPYETLEDLADDISERAKDGEDFDALTEEFNIDPGVASSPDGYFFTYGAMVTEFETAAFDMEVGDISAPVQTDYGYHILYKVPMTDDSIAANISTLESDWASVKLGELIEAKVASYTVTYTPQYDNLTLDILVPELLTAGVTQ